MVRIVEDGSEITTLDVSCRQVLIRMTEASQTYWHHLLLHRIDKAVWVTADPDLVVLVEDLAGEEIIPLRRNALFPGPGRPYLTFDALTPAQLASLMNQGESLAAVHGIVGTVPSALSFSILWVFADPGHALFGQDVQ